ncbi:MAG: hypothetical protein JXA57_13820 [Armatimonadetes bacterium]|nr:hypothetical protein [Armatimonadota bacterium]
MAKRIKQSEFVGIGCVIQALGILCPFVGGAVAGPIGVVLGLGVGVGLFIYGGRRAVKWKCSVCKNPLPAKDVMVCPVCKATFDE